MFNKYIKTQHVCISVSELFHWWDRLDSDPDNAFELFTEFLEKAEDTLEVNLDSFDDDDFVPLTVKSEDDLFEADYDEFAKRTNAAYKRVKEEDKELLSSDEFLEELNDWTKNNNNTLAYNPYNWNVKKVKK